MSITHLVEESQMKTPEQIFEKPTSDYLRVMTASPEAVIADPKANTKAILACYDQAKQQQAELLTLPELCVTGYSTADLFFNRHVLEQASAALKALASATESGPALVVGAPIENNGILYNCGVMLAEGKIAGIVPKSYLPNYGEFYEDRWFTEGQDITNRNISVDGNEIPFGVDILFNINDTNVAIEVCEDLFAPISPSAQHALAGAEVIVNTSASNEVVGKPEYRKMLVASTAARLLCAYVYASAGKGESNADTVYGGHQIIGEVGKIVCETKPMAGSEPTLYDVDVTYLRHDRIVNKTFGRAAEGFRKTNTYRTVFIETLRPMDEKLHRSIVADAHMPQDNAELDERCEYIFGIMSNALAQRIEESRTHSMVIGLSGGLDSTLALLVAEHACRLIEKPNGFIHTIGMPGPASSDRTQDNAVLLAEALETTHNTFSIGELSNTALKKIGHDGANEDTTYENTQARMRTLLLMNYANKIQGMVVGTGDMSEIAQGWCTYNGDHMSMFNPNAGVPKTLVRHLVRWYAKNVSDLNAKDILLDIIETPISPELTGNGDLEQTTEDIIGPYELLDFFGKEERRYGSRPKKIGYLATIAFQGKYTEAAISHWLDSYLKRFTSSQWKREAMPNGPKIGTVSLSPRTDLRLAPNTSADWHK